MHRMKLPKNYLARISFILKNFHNRNTHSNPSACCFSNENQNFILIKDRPVQFSFAAASLLTYLGLAKNELEEFRAIVEKGEKALAEKNFELAQQLLHEALLIAQVHLKDETEVTRIYELLGDAALEKGDYRSAKKLFKSVMERLFSIGVDQNDLRILNLSFKLAKTSEHLQKYRDAELGYRYCIRGIQTHLTSDNPYLDRAQDFLLMLLIGYAYFHYDRGLWNNALEYFDQAYEVCVRTRGEDDHRAILILNNLGTVNRKKGDEENALRYFLKAEKLGENFPDLKDVSYVHLNLGYLYLEKKMLYDARRHCKRALTKSKKTGDGDAIAESRECLAEIRKSFASNLFSQIW